MALLSQRVMVLRCIGRAAWLVTELLHFVRFLEDSRRLSKWQLGHFILVARCTVDDSLPGCCLNRGLKHRLHRRR